MRYTHLALALGVVLSGTGPGQGGARAIPPAPAPPPRLPSAALLADHGIEPDVKGVTGFLRALDPRPIAAWIKQLGSDNFREREEATRQLIRSPAVSSAVLAEAARSKDPEVRRRAKEILRKVGTRDTPRLVFAAFETIRRGKLRVPVTVQLTALTYLKEDYLATAGRQALVASARPEDLAALREALAGTEVPQRVAATLALAAILGDRAGAELRPLLKDKHEWVRLAAALALAGRGERRALGALVDLLSAEEFRIRSRTVELLRALTGKRFGYLPAETPAGRKKAITGWKAWLAAEGRTAKLRLPLKETTLEPSRWGHFWVSIKGECQLSVNGKEVLATGGGKKRSGMLSLRAGDVVVARIRSRWVYRALRMAFVSEDGRALLSFRRGHFRHVDALSLDKIDAAAVARGDRPPRPGRPDGGYKKGWAGLTIAGDDSEWMWGWKKNAWHQIACVIHPTQFKTAPALEVRKR